MRLVFLNSLLLLFFLSGLPALAQRVSTHEQGGRPFGMKEYNEVDLPNIWQNWSMTQDDRGLIYVANNAGVLEFDGTGWRLIEIAGSNAAFSVDVDTTGRIYVGSRAEFGYLTPDSTGNKQYTSLMAHVDSTDTGFIEVWNTAVTPEGIYFQASNRLFRWDGATMKSWSSSHRLHTSFAVNDRFYVKQDSVGLLTVVEDSLALVPGGGAVCQQADILHGSP